MTLKLTVNLASKGFDQPMQLALPTQGVTAVFGPSGCGKTSLLRAISGLDQHPTSHVEFEGEVWQNDQSFVPTHQRGLAYVFQEASLFEHLTVEQNLDFALKRRQTIEGNTAVKSDAVELLNIGHLLLRSSNTLSGGEQQRVAIARALCANPRLLLMDEPLSALDAGHKAEILPFLEALCRGTNTPIVYVSHSINEVARLADHMVLLDNGVVLAQGPTSDMLSRLDLSLTQRADAAAVLDGTVRHKDTEFALTRVHTQAGELFVTHAEQLAVGSAVRLKLCARDVSIALEQPKQTSILNCVRAQIIEMQYQEAAQVLVRLDASGAPLLAKITKKSQQALNLNIGQSVVLQIKSVALL